MENMVIALTSVTFLCPQPRELTRYRLVVPTTTFSMNETFQSVSLFPPGSSRLCCDRMKSIYFHTIIRMPTWAAMVFAYLAYAHTRIDELADSKGVRCSANRVQ